MRTLVTGAAGFIGSHLCGRLVAEGHEVVGLDDLSDGTLENLASVPEVRFRGGRPPRRGRGAGGRRWMPRRLPPGCHALGSALDRSAGEKPRRQRTGDAERVARGPRHAGKRPLRILVFGVWDQEIFPLREDMAPLLRSPYAASKLAGEAYCRSWWLSFGVPTVSLRYFNVYGPGQDPANEYAAVVPRFVMACLNGSSPEVHGGGDQSRDFTFIDDVVEANLLAGLAPEEARGWVLNVGGGREPTSVNRILEIVAGSTDAAPEPVHTAPREGDVRRTEADVSLARRLIGYEPKVDIEEGLRRTVEWFR